MVADKEEGGWVRWSRAGMGDSPRKVKETVFSRGAIGFPAGGRASAEAGAPRWSVPRQLQRLRPKHYRFALIRFLMALPGCVCGQ